MFLLLSILTSSIAISHASTFPDHLQNRAPSYGAYALAADPCPQGLAKCAPNSYGKCCPSQFPFCDISTDVTGTACCPNSNRCLSAVKAAAPACADDSWVLWQGRNSGYFCCQQDQIGIIAGRTVVGSCVPSTVPVPATQSATKVSPASGSMSASSTSQARGTTSSTANSASQASGTTTSTAISTSQASGTTTSTATSASQASGTTTSTATTPTTTSTSKPAPTGGAAGNVISAEGVFSGIVGALGSLFLTFLF